MAETVKLIAEEANFIRNVYEAKGLNEMVETLYRRSSEPGASLLLLSTSKGEILGGNIANVEPWVLRIQGLTQKPFAYTRFRDEEAFSRFALAEIHALNNGMRLLVGRDTSTAEKLQLSNFRTLFIAISVLVILAVLLWLIMGRRALNRLDLMSASANRILRGDLNERLPLSGVDDEFDRLSSTMNQLLERITGLDHAVREVSDNVAHDLKTPLTRIRNKIESAASLADENYQSTFESLAKDIDQLLNTFEALLTISKLQSGVAKLSKEQINLTLLLKNMLELYEPLLEEENIHLTLDVSEALKVTGSRELLSQALSNLIDNAVKYGKPTGNIRQDLTVSLKIENNQPTLTIADNGVGVSDSDKQKVRQRFVRINPSRTGAGFGLGLNLVDAVAEANNATLILADNNPGLRVILKFQNEGAAK